MAKKKNKARCSGTASKDDAGGFGGWGQGVECCLRWGATKDRIRCHSCRSLREEEESSPGDLWGRALEEEEGVNGKCIGNEYGWQFVCDEFSSVSRK